jgi:hypothetical protein
MHPSIRDQAVISVFAVYLAVARRFGMQEDLFRVKVASTTIHGPLEAWSADIFLAAM